MIPTELTCLHGEESCLCYVLVLCGTNRTYMFTRRRELSLLRSSLCDTNRTYIFTRRRELSLLRSSLVWYQQNLHIYKEKRIDCLCYVLVLCDTNRTYMFTRRRELSLLRSSLVWYQQNLHIYMEKRSVSVTF